MKPTTSSPKKLTSVLDPKIYDEAIIFITKLGIEPITKEELQITVYPNPTTGEFTIKNEELKIKSVEIYDIMGRKFFEDKENLTVLRSYDLTFFPSGVYFLRIQTETGTVTKKIIKQ